VAISAEKQARAKELKAAKFSRKAEIAQLAALNARAQASKAHSAAAIAQELAEEKITEIKTAAEQLKNAEKQVKKSKKMAMKKQRAMYKAARKTDAVFTPI